VKAAKRKHDLKEIIRSLAPVVYPALREEYCPNCCIAAVAILIRVFDHYGYKATAVPVTMRIYNAAMVKALENKIKISDDKERFFFLTGAWGIGIVPQSAAASGHFFGGGYGGHLLVRAGNWLLDPTIRQADRPERKMPLPNMLFTEGARELERTGELGLMVGDCAVIYNTLDDQSYRTATDWERRATPFPETVRRILARAEVKP
jgi:hypothetical protein